MKKTFLILAASVSISGLMAQSKPTTAKPATKTAVKTTTAQQGTIFKNGLDSMSYAMGLSIAQFYKMQGIENFNTQLLTQAINDAKNNKPLLNEEQMNASISSYMQKMKAEKASGNKKAGAAFLTANKTKPGVVTLPDGLQYMILQKGSGVIPTINDKVKVHYHGTLIDGTVFDSSVDRGEPIEFPVGNVIKGWVEALQLMPQGSKWRLFIPSDLAYGDNQAGDKIKPGSTLIFDVELLDVIKQ